jgi:4-alpha-glucanotransferase
MNPHMNTHMNTQLHDLAHAAGIEIHWRDNDGNARTVSDDSLRAVLAAIDLPANTPAQIHNSLAELGHKEQAAPPLITADLGRPVHIAGMPGPFRITMESGHSFDGHAHAISENRVELPGLNEPGYHRLEFAGAMRTLAVAPLRAFTLEDAGQGRKLWGLAVQLYALRRQGDGGIGDFVSLAALAASAARHGADALAISPVHAQFSANPEHFSPYAPSSRAALNALHIAEPGEHEGGTLIDWPLAGAAKLRALRHAYQHFHDHEALDEFRHKAGDRITRHALFEAIQAALVPGNDSAKDWRNWPQAYRDPQNPAALRFLQDHAHEVGFHAWLQYRADKELLQAQRTAREAGMRIGLIADLAVGADHAGSQSWSYQNQVLRGLEIGAPPDAVNREGQSWGITALAPYGMRRGGYTAFLEMLRHALRHAGGVRIDHIMGLARLWVIPLGAASDQGAYLKLPAEDLLRLVALESQRHRAVIIGEDLGTLPDGFQERLNRAGISGLRVMWFERTGAHFNPPSAWTPTAVAMSTTHDLPTVAGWWQRNDIAWRARLSMAGDSTEQREADRAELWMAFRTSGATHAPIPGPEQSGAAADAACAHIGLAASTLALLPIEDALALPEQPNLPGTTHQHPNWRRRLPAPADELLDSPDVAARLAALTRARSGP